MIDNAALNQALQTRQPVIPLYILDDRLLSRAAPQRRAFLLAALHALDASLRRLGSSLVVRRGDALEELSRLCAESAATHIFAEEDFSAYARQRDGRVAGVLPLHLTGGFTMLHPARLVKADGTPYTVFTPFSRFWRAQPAPSAPAQELPPGLRDALVPTARYGSQPLPSAPPPNDIASEEEAQRRLRAFTDHAIHPYDTQRNFPAVEGTSHLSPYLRFGLISARTALAAARQAAQTHATPGCETWINELIWREFYHTILYHFPHVQTQPFKAAFKAIPWRDAPADLQAWREGRTGYPLVDAAMRQLQQSGWMHNRCRMVCASFLVKDLLINWQAGERWFMQNLVDGDIAANNGGWQWCAGTGSDAAPYFRIFSPLRQSQTFDPQGEYIRRWLPELRAVPTPWIHEPWRMPPDVQHTGKDYPPPLVDHAQARQRTLAAFAAARNA